MSSSSLKIIICAAVILLMFGCMADYMPSHYYFFTRCICVMAFSSIGIMSVYENKNIHVIVCILFVVLFFPYIGFSFNKSVWQIIDGIVILLSGYYGYKRFLEPVELENEDDY
ncbi:DUF6804 family protein [Pedobacter sp. N23S346]|uniref:DUF6804 family protein n=1 Tax=Pedobacter sp. N23S346 TaxID=3402750 RepID=UPI003AC39C8D